MQIFQPSASPTSRKDPVFGGVPRSWCGVTTALASSPLMVIAPIQDVQQAGLLTLLVHEGLVEAAELGAHVLAHQGPVGRPVRRVVGVLFALDHVADLVLVGFRPGGGGGGGGAATAGVVDGGGAPTPKSV